MPPWKLGKDIWWTHIADSDRPVIIATDVYPGLIPVANIPSYNQNLPNTSEASRVRGQEDIGVRSSDQKVVCLS